MRHIIKRTQIWLTKLKYDVEFLALLVSSNITHKCVWHLGFVRTYLMGGDTSNRGYFNFSLKLEAKTYKILLYLSTISV